MTRPRRTFELYLPIAKRDDDKRLVFGWMYQSTDKHGRIIVDKHDDFMLPQDLEEAAYKYVDSSRVGGVMHLRDSHMAVAKRDKPYAVASLVESMVFTPEKCEALGIAKNAIPNGAWWVGYRVNHDKVWSEVKKGRLKGFSIHGAAIRRRIIGKSETAVSQQATPATAPAPSAPGVQTTVTTGPNGKTTKKTKKTSRPSKPQGLDKAMDVLANAKE